MSSPHESKQKLRVLTWNVLWRDRDERATMLRDAVTQTAADVLLLQETSFEHSLNLGERLDMSVVYVGERGSSTPVKTGTSILLARDLEYRIINTPALPPTPYEAGPPMQPTAIELLPQSTAPIAIISIHLSHSRKAALQGLVPPPNDDNLRDGYSMAKSIEARKQQILELLNQHAGRDRLILGGDHNFVPDSPEYQVMTTAGLIDAWRSGPRTSAGATIVHDCPFLDEETRSYPRLVEESQPGNRGPWSYTLDYQFIKGIVPENAWVVGYPSEKMGWVSDHLGLLVDYNLGAV